jgi:hypothetical protein
MAAARGAAPGRYKNASRHKKYVVLNPISIMVKEYGDPDVPLRQGKS